MDNLRELIGLMIMDGYEPEEIRRVVEDAIKDAPRPPQDEDES